MVMLTPLVSIVVAAVVALVQAVVRHAEATRSSAPAEPAPPEVGTVVAELAAVATDPDVSQDARLTAAVAALAVAQAKPARENLLKTYVLPVIIVVVGLLAPFVSHVADAVDPSPVDCSKYLDTVSALPSLAPDPERLAELASAMHPSADQVKHCGGTPTDVLRHAGRIP